MISNASFQTVSEPSPEPLEPEVIYVKEIVEVEQLTQFTGNNGKISKAMVTAKAMVRLW